MAADDELHPPLYRHRRALEVLVGVLQKAVIEVHGEASLLTGRSSKELHDVADDIADYAEYLKERLNHPRFRKLHP